MGFFKKRFRRESAHQANELRRRRARRTRMRGAEALERRQLLAADVHVGVVYYEEDSGQDTAPDVFHITFEGGPDDTQLAQLIIDTDKAGDGLSVADGFFDTEDGGAGTFESHGPQILSQAGIDSVTFDVVDGGTQLLFTFEGFDPGETLVFGIDVDERGFLPGSSSAVTEGAEFEGSQFIATLSAPHHFDLTGSAVFLDSFDHSGLPFTLPPDEYVPPSTTPQAFRTAGAALSDQMTPLPITISGTVFEDFDLDNDQDPGDPGIADVTLQLWQFDGTDYVATGKTTTTDGDGNYEFTDVLPGRYRVVEVQPADLFSVGATAGTVDGATRGSVLSPDVITEIDLLGGDDSIDNDFAEARPASLAGHVFHDADDDGVFDAGETGIGGVTIQVQRLPDGAPPEAPIEVQTLADGSWAVTGLRPGNYVVREVQPEGYLDGKDAPGNLGGTALPQPGDEISSVFLFSGQAGINYDFGEILPSSISGFVHADRDGNCVLDPGDQPLEGVVIELLDGTGTPIATTATNAQGRYEFTGLAPGVYSVREVQPAGYFDGDDHVGTAGGQHIQPDTLAQIVLTSGTNAEHYDFCEHEPASLSGHVYVDDNQNGQRDAGEAPIAGVTLELKDADGNLTGITTTTDDTGFYRFDNLRHGTYGVQETQPAGFFDGLDSPGSAGGVAANPGDMITGAVLTPGLNAVNYDFGELRPASISGRVHADRDGDCVLDPTDLPLAGVTILLLDASGNQVASTTTNDAGEYSFDNLAPGTYSVVEQQPAGFFDGDDHVGSAGGALIAPDTIANITLGSGTAATEYNFCEHEPASLSGHVYVDNNQNGQRDPGEAPIAGVTLELKDAGGNLTGITTTTDAAGFYRFENLRHGTYGVQETQPAGFFDGLDSPGSAGGVAANPGDMISGAVLTPGLAAVNYDFGELRPASISGTVHVDDDGDCLIDAGEQTLSGVTIYLLDAAGNRIDSTTTDASGTYFFANLAPGEYGVEEVQPEAFQTGGEHVGTAGGTVTGDNFIRQITLGSGENALDYNFCERHNGTISGFVFQDGGVIELNSSQTLSANNLRTFRDGARTADDLPIPGVSLQLTDISGQIVLDASAQPMVAVTDENGFYEFTGLAPGVYTIIQSHPEGYLDGIDTAGTTGGLAINAGVDADLVPLGMTHNFDAIVGVVLPPGGASVENNFSEVIAQIEDPPPETPQTPIFPNNPPSVPPLPARGPLGGGRPIPGGIANPPTPPSVQSFFFGGGVVPTGGYTWHLSVINAGYPRGEQAGSAEIVQVRSRQLDRGWENADLSQGRWLLSTYDTGGQVVEFGMVDATPVTGDWNGDGVTEVGMFRDGEWFLDLNGNGRWDTGDLWAQLGSATDRPVTGDWDGDGKTDIGIFGPEWLGDPPALRREPGLPDADNEPSGRKKNVPPEPHEATSGRRVLQRTEHGRFRSDVIDHVFRYGSSGDVPVTGDWNGDGIDTIGVFAGGVWFLDLNGDGMWDIETENASYGDIGDVPVAGDYDGDGIDELAVYRNGRWYVDINHNGVADEDDLEFRLGQAGDVPVVGDWDGDGVEEPGVYREGRTYRVDQ